MGYLIRSYIIKFPNDFLGIFLNKSYLIKLTGGSAGDRGPGLVRGNDPGTAENEGRHYSY